MASIFPIKGYFYLPNQQDQRIAGILSIEQERFRLELFGSFNGNSYANYLDSLDRESSSTIPLILGRGSNGKDYSLISSIQGASSLNFNADFPLTSYLTDTVLQGCLLDDPNEAIFKKIRIEFSHLQEWLGFTGILPNGIDRNGFNLSYRYPESIVFPINDKRKMTFGYKYNYDGPNRYQRDIVQTCFLEIENESPLSYQNLSQSMYLFKDFLSLATLSEPHIKSTKLYWELPSTDGLSFENIELDLFINPPTTNPSKEKHFSMFLFQYDDVKTLLPTLLQNWFALDDDIWPIRRYLIESIKPRKSFEINHFLNIIQALEGFHRRFRVDKKTDLRVRLKALLQEFSNINLIKSTFQDADEILSQVVDSRHYYSHFFKKENDKTLDGKNLYYLTQKVRMLLIACVLKEIGLNEATINSALSHLRSSKQNPVKKTNSTIN